jgi:hypothetical protein
VGKLKTITKLLIRKGSISLTEQVKAHIALFAVGGDCVLKARDELVSQLPIRHLLELSKEGHADVMRHGV